MVELIALAGLNKSDLDDPGDHVAGINSLHWASIERRATCCTDSGRTLPGYAEVGPKQTNKYVGMFYFLWHGAHGTALYDNTKLLAANPSNPQYGSPGTFHWWGEPEAGYYLATDPWVIRRNASMLVDAGVDVIFFDVTNAATYKTEYTALANTYQQIRSEGGKTPPVCLPYALQRPRHHQHVVCGSLLAESLLRPVVQMGRQAIDVRNSRLH